MFHKLCWACEGLAAKGHDHGYHSLFTNLSSSLHGDVTFRVLAEGLIISLLELRECKQLLETLAQDSRNKAWMGPGCKQLACTLQNSHSCERPKKKKADDLFQMKGNQRCVTLKGNA